MDHLTVAMSSSFPNSVIAKRFLYKRTKAIVLISKVLCVHMKDKMLLDVPGNSDCTSDVKYSTGLIGKSCCI